MCRFNNIKLQIPFRPRPPGKRKSSKATLAGLTGIQPPRGSHGGYPHCLILYPYRAVTGQAYHYPDLMVLAQLQLPNCISNETLSLVLLREVFAHRYTSSHQNESTRRMYILLSIVLVASLLQLYDSGKVMVIRGSVRPNCPASEAYFYNLLSISIRDSMAFLIVAFISIELHSILPRIK